MYTGGFLPASNLKPSHQLHGIGTGDKSVTLSGESIAIDGKTVRGEFYAQKEQKAIHPVSAWAMENRLVFA
jgi:hypothetical protein